MGVASSGSFTKTAQRLHLSQAALSTMVRELESQLGCRLFHRTTRAVELTEAGRRFLPVATQIVESLEAAATELGALDRLNGSRLNIGVTPMMATSLLPLVLTRFRAVMPDVEIGVADAAPADLRELVECGDIDAGFGAFFTRVSGLDREPVFTSRIQVVQPRGAEVLKGGTIRWSDLAGQAVVTVTEASPVQQLVEAQLTKLTIAPKSRLVVNQLETVIAFAEAGLGIGIIPSFAGAACRRYAVSIANLGPAVEFQFQRIVRAGHPSSPALTAFSELFAAVAEELDSSGARGTPPAVAGGG
ncbi:LysR family transcriptional regulator [Aquabacterium sp. J223]|uniref:LysR family transcriptional regulator n=1 Tax=Aquabacterium sp. J223 TaxID=2898431 RepID=UPI0021AD738F|nr:LysR family transcriptional regulator [Aquabacterium sp. J223]